MPEEGSENVEKVNMSYAQYEICAPILTPVAIGGGVGVIPVREGDKMKQDMFSHHY